MHTNWLKDHGWEGMVWKVRKRGDIRVDEQTMDWHPGAPLLKQLGKHGVPVKMTTAPWPQPLKDERVRRGSHKSCQDHRDFIRGELLDFVEKGFWILLPYHRIKHWTQLRVSPLGCIPQRNRRPRLIVDYSYYGINSETLALQPSEAMQFGRTLERVLYQVRHSNKRFGPVHLGKVDIADGFYRIWLAIQDIPNLGVVFPRYPGEDQLIALPLTLPMGWVASPPYFCAFTETVADVATNYLKQVGRAPHVLEKFANTPPKEQTPGQEQHHRYTPTSDDRPPWSPPLPNHRSTHKHDVTQTGSSTAPSNTRPTPVLRPFQKPVNFFDVYVDDFCTGVQGSLATRQNHQRRLLRAIDSVFRPVDTMDPPTRKHAPSTKKILEGGAFLTTRKTILGWIVDTIWGTLKLPPHRIQRLHAIFELRGAKRVGLTKWHHILGELMSVFIGVPGSRGLFSTLQMALKFTDKGRILVTPQMTDHLTDFEHLVRELGKRPTKLSEIVPDHPVAVGPHNASGRGMGGVWIPTTTQSALRPTLWRARSPRMPGMS